MPNRNHNGRKTAGRPAWGQTGAPEENMVSQPDPDRDAGPLAEYAWTEAEHLLKVAASVVKDANVVWAEMWAQFKPHITPGGVISDHIAKGFTPQCGWPEFLEKYWLLKHYLDSIDRICRRKH